MYLHMCGCKYCHCPNIRVFLGTEALQSFKRRFIIRWNILRNYHNGTLNFLCTVDLEMSFHSLCQIGQYK